jgi:hypothetical protein
MKNVFKYIIFVVLSLYLTGCNEDALMPDSAEVQGTDAAIAAKNDSKALKATGEVEVYFMSNPGGKSGENHQAKEMPEPKPRYADVIFNAHEASKNNSAKGAIAITIKDEFGAVKREIEAEVYDVEVVPDDHIAWIIAEVVKDERHSGDHNDGSHDDGSHTDGSHDDSTHDDGSHDDASHDDGSHDDHDGGCGSDDDSHGNKSRVGDSMALVVFDGGSPGTNGDKLKWKWYGENHPHVSIPDHIELGEKCQKEIISGNLVVHVK